MILIVFYMSINIYIYVYLNIEIQYLEIKKCLKENISVIKVDILFIF